MPQRTLTIVICTFNRAAILKECIESLMPQLSEEFSDRVEILIVDNNSDDDTKETVRQFKTSKIAYVFEPTQGLSYARNTGYKNANSEWVAYLDDDALAAHDWLARIFWLIENTDFEAFGGAFDPWYRDGKVSWYLDEYATNRTWLKYEKISHLKQQNFCGGNAVYSKKSLTSVDGFPIDLGMSAGKVAYGEETEVQQKLRAKNYKLGYDPELIIHHYVAPYKQRLSWFFVRAHAAGKVYWRANHLKPTPSLLLSLLLSMLTGLVRDIRFCFSEVRQGRYKLKNCIICIGERLLLKACKFFYGASALFLTKGHKSG